MDNVETQAYDGDMVATELQASVPIHKALSILNPCMVMCAHWQVQEAAPEHGQPPQEVQKSLIAQDPEEHLHVAAQEPEEVDDNSKAKHTEASVAHDGKEEEEADTPVLASCTQKSQASAAAAPPPQPVSVLSFQALLCESMHTCWLSDLSVCV